jgi:ABC-2 type transport system permease protein
MKNTFYQMLHSMKYTFMDTKPLISKFLTIIVVILILGSAFKDAFSTSSLDPVRLGYLNEDEGEIGEILLDNLLESDDIKGWIELVKVDSFEQGQSLTGDSSVSDEDRIDGMIYIDKDFSNTYENGDPCKVKIYCGKTSQVEATVIKCVFDTFSNMVNLNKVILEEFGTNVSEEFSSDNGVEELPMKSEKKPGAMDYYAIAMLMMFLIFSAEYGCDNIAEDYLGVIGERIKTTPLKPYQQYIGKIFGLCVSSTIQGLFLVLFTKIVYDVNWGSNYLMVLLVVFSMSCTAVALGALICMITRDRSRGQSIVTALVIACTFLAGGFVKMDMGEMKYLSPNYYAQTSLITTIYGGDMSTTYLYVGILWGITAVAGILTVLLSRRKKA